MAGKIRRFENVLGGCSVLSAGCELGGIGLTDLIINSLLELLGDWQVILISSRNRYMDKLEHESGWLPSFLFSDTASPPHLLPAPYSSPL